MGVFPGVSTLAPVLAWMIPLGGLVSPLPMYAVLQVGPQAMEDEASGTMSWQRVVVALCGAC